MIDVMGVIHHVKYENCLQSLTQHRSIGAVPFGAKYRLIDFILSNMVNADIKNVGIITSLNLRSLLDHLGNGKEWGLDKKEDGMFILPAAPQKRRISIVDLEDFYINKDYLKRSKQKYLVIAGSNVIYKLDYSKVLSFHEKKNSDITIIYKKDQSWNVGEAPHVFLKTDDNQRILGIYTKNNVKRTDSLALDTYIIKKDLLLEILEDCFLYKKWDLVKHVIAKRLKELKIYGYYHQGFSSVINSLDSYFNYQMELLLPEKVNDLFISNGSIYTKFNDSPPTKYYQGSEVNSSLVANGCKIAGKVNNSIIFRNVKVARGASIHKCVIMPECVLGKNTCLENVILDKNVNIPAGTVLKGSQYVPLVLGKGWESWEERSVELNE